MEEQRTEDSVYVVQVEPSRGETDSKALVHQSNDDQLTGNNS